MLNLRPEIHFKDLPQPIAADIQTILSKQLQRDMEQEAIANLFGGQDLQTALKNAVCDISRVLRPSGFVSFDAEKEDDLNLFETLAAPELEGLEAYRAPTLDAATESLLKLLGGGTAALGRQLGVGQRRAQQLLKKEIERLKNGGDGQGDLFGGVK